MELLPLSIERALSCLLAFICRDGWIDVNLGVSDQAARTLQGCCRTQCPSTAFQLRSGSRDAAFCILSQFCLPVLKPSGARQPNFLPLSAKTCRLLSSSREPQALHFALPQHANTSASVSGMCSHIEKQGLCANTAGS